MTQAPVFDGLILFEALCKNTQNRGGNISITAGFPSGPIVPDGQRAVIAVVTFRLIAVGEADIQLAPATELRSAPGQPIVLKTRKGVAIQVRD